MVQLTISLLARYTHYGKKLNSGQPNIIKRLSLWRTNALFRGRKRNCFAIGMRYRMKALRYATQARKRQAAEQRDLHVTRLTAATEEHGIPFDYFWKAIRDMDIGVNRKVMVDLSVHEPRSFASLCQLAKQRLIDQGLNLPPHSCPDISVITRGMKDVKL